VLYRDASLGTLHLALSLEPVAFQVRTSRQTTAIVSVGILVLGALAAFVLSTTFIGPLGAMARTVEMIAQGDLDHRAEVVSNDEVSDLARSFNTMVGTLESAQRELEDLNRALEHRVAARTEALREEIDERKRIEAALRSSEDRLHKVVEHLPEGVLLLDTDFTVLLANPPAIELSASAGLLETGRRLFSIAGAPLLRVAAAGATGGWIEIVTRDDPRRVLEVTMRDLGGPDARAGRIVVLRDVTRDRDVQEQLRQSDRLASLGQLASGIAHDFRNILQGMMMSAELLLVHSELSPSEEEELQSILKHGGRGAGLITQILDFSRRSISSRSRLDLGELLSTSVPMLRRLIPEAISVELELPKEPLLVNGDATQLQQVVVNLALNARDAMPGGGRIEIRLCRAGPGTRQESRIEIGPPGESDGPWILLQVKDHGRGIPEAIRDHVFEPFFTTKPPGSGTGLGLSQVYGIVGQHEGAVTFESGADSGTTFSVWLPETRSLPLPGESSEDQASLPEGAGQKLLVVEDESSLRRGLRKGLESLGYAVLDAADGLSALSIWKERRHEIALVLMDVVMPCLGGIELMQRIAVDLPAPPMILMTGHPLGEDERTLINRLEVPLIEKPVSLDALARAVDRALSPARRARPTRPHRPPHSPPA
jgi:signal transduction histidine kinase/HAMP domain-containing protein/ActR/RegA family two-component response regulator